VPRDAVEAIRPSPAAVAFHGYSPVVRWFLLAFLALVACKRETERSVPAPPAPGSGSGSDAVAGAAAASGGCRLADVPARLPAAERVIAIGDLHGDLAAARAALRAGGVIDGDDAWIGGKTVVVQTGDILDRGDDEQAIIDLFERLERDAAAAGGAVIWLLGNHELMNAEGDFRYVTPGGFADFADVPGLDTSGLSAAPAEERARIAAFRPGGPYAQILAGQNTIAIVGDTVFAHGGLVGPWATRIDEINRDDRCWLAGAGELPAAAGADDGPVWTRVYGSSEVDCAGAATALADIGVKRMVVAHTVQPSGMNAVCDGTVWRIDVGLAALYNGPIEVLELRADGEPRVLRGKRP
jgi:hypothetical protein